MNSKLVKKRIREDYIFKELLYQAFINNKKYFQSSIVNTKDLCVSISDKTINFEIADLIPIPLYDQFKVIKNSSSTANKPNEPKQLSISSFKPIIKPMENDDDDILLCNYGLEKLALFNNNNKLQ